MNNPGSLTPPGSSKKQSKSTANPFARALAESEKSTFAGKKPQDEKNDLFGEALARTGGQIPQENSPEELEKKQAELKKEQKKAELHKKLHDQVNPVDQKDIFSASKERTKKELEEVRKELKILAKEIGKFYKEVDIQTTQGITTQGISGTGLKSYFQKLKSFIILLTQKVKSARTWMRAQKSKQQRMKSRKIKGGMPISGGGAEQSKTVFDMMHHERSTAYSGS